MKWKGLKDLEQHLRPIEEIREDPKNPRRHPERNIKDVAKSLDARGQHRAGILSKSGWLSVGNGMLRAAKMLGWTHLAVMESPDTDREARERGIADNRTAEHAEWEYSILKDYLIEIDDGSIDIESIGYTTEEIESLVNYGIDNIITESKHKCPKCGFEW